MTDTPADVTALGAVELGALLARGGASSTEVTRAYLDRIERLDPSLKAFVTVDGDRASAAALRADERLSKGRALGPIDGVPIAVKDNIAVAGLPSTCGVKGRSDAVAAEDAEVVAQLRGGGAVIIGTLNMHEGALGATTDNPVYGRCLNPWGPLEADVGWTPGGSSGGSGAAVAARLCAAALGTDTMGSVRIPASYCGVYGFKPSFGRVSDKGLGHLSWSLDHIGPLARRAADLPAIMDVMTGAVSASIAAQSAPWAEVRIGVLEADVETDAAVAGRVEEAVARIIALGAPVTQLAPTLQPPGALRRAGLLVSEAEGAVAFAEERAAGGDALTDGFANMLGWGARQPAEKLAAAQWALRQARLALREAIAAAEVDIILAPTAPQTAFLHGEEVPVNQADFTCLANIADLPAASVPIAPVDGRPVGLQVIGQPGGDMDVLRVMLMLEAQAGPPTDAPI